MRMVTLLVSMALLAGCGSGEREAAPAPSTPAPEASPERPGKAGDREPKGEGTEIVLAGSEFGDMLYDTRRQAIYVFELDGEDETNCHGGCAEAWPPVYTGGEPVAGEGVDPALLGTIEREGRLQVTYAGRPLYFYAHEEPGEVRCHNVDLNGGLWWVVGADGEPLP